MEVPMSDYDSDILVWSEHQANLLRRLAAGETINDQVDFENIAEEIEALGRSDRRELRSRIATILLHLIKLQASPSTEPRAGWHETLFEQRAGIRAVLQDSPSLRPMVPVMIMEELPEVRERALVSLRDYGEHPSVDIVDLTYDEDEVLGSWLP
jgi:hypothetical protein